MATFVKSVIIDAPVETVFAFHERPDALQVLSPPFPPMRVLRKNGGIETGSRVELRMGLMEWEALHTAFERNQVFADRQIRGPFLQWEHRHEFEDLGDTTRLTDRVTYLLPGGLPAHVALGWLVKLALEALFAYRHRVTKRICEKDSGARS